MSRCTPPRTRSKKKAKPRVTIGWDAYEACAGPRLPANCSEVKISAPASHSSFLLAYTMVGVLVDFVESSTEIEICGEVHLVVLSEALNLFLKIATSWVRQSDS